VNELIQIRETHSISSPCKIFLSYLDSGVPTPVEGSTSGVDQEADKEIVSGHLGRRRIRFQAAIVIVVAVVDTENKTNINYG
jgi:hypothetical protein